MIPSSEKISKDLDKELVTKQHEGCQGHAAQNSRKGKLPL
jgi:hypothetical protein